MNGRSEVDRSLAGLLILVALLVGACRAEQATPPRPQVPARVTPSVPVAGSPTLAAPPRFDVERTLEHARFLVEEIGVRLSGTEGDRRAAAYLEAVMAGAGLEVQVQEFTRVNGGRTQNVIGRIPGARYQDGYVVVGAHYDTEAQGPGANDNASGVGVMLALAETFANHGVAVEFVGFGAEEFDYDNRVRVEGSRFYVSRLEDPGIVDALLSLDMVGNGPRVIVVRREGFSAELQSEIGEIAADLEIPHELRAEGDISDHVSFARAGVKAAHLWSGMHPTLHRPTDTMAVVQEESLQRVGGLALEWLKRRTGIAP